MGPLRRHQLLLHGQQYPPLAHAQQLRQAAAASCSLDPQDMCACASDLEPIGALQSSVLCSGEPLAVQGMDSTNREKCMRIDNHTVHNTSPAPCAASGLVGQSGLPSHGPAVHHLKQLPPQHCRRSCKTPSVAQQHAEGDELATSKHCPACGSVALPIDPHVVSKNLSADGASHTLPLVPCRLSCSSIHMA